MIGFALLGCGRIAQRHAEIIGSGAIDGAQLAAVCDIDGEKAQALAKRFGVTAYADIDEMMERDGERIDVVSILTPSGLHAEHCLATAPYGKHVVVEKPMALTIDDADAMIRACDEAGVKLFVVKQNRYNVPVQKLREAFESGRFGKVVMGTTRVRWCRTQSYYDQDSWRGTWRLDGGVFANQASHHIDLLEWFLGEPESVYAVTSRALVNIEAEDTGAAVIRFRSGAVGIVEATTATRPHDLEGSLSILGERGTVEIGGFAVNEMRVWDFVDPTPEDREVVTRFRENPPDVYGFGHRAYLAHVVESLTRGAPSLVDGLEGRKSVELINAMYESAESGRPVALRFTARRSRLGIG